MKCVTNTSPLSWLAKVGQLELLTELYDEIYAPPGVYSQLQEHIPTKEFLTSHILPIGFNEKELMRFNKLTRRWFRKLRLDDAVEVEVFVSYEFFLDVDEMLFANKDAEEHFRKRGNVRDISTLYELAEKKGIFSREDSIRFLRSFL